ncbi:hypothetical protein QAD02_006246 [Eretmocerus hayati]|uniref:Uncharacterized protein n=1 Tax=Eretmocerus hayati TaxID=131215 RepID=A0ACC2N0E9_9HYME|nr:hypothetical protein QAD02_006246 [Eretmocerus hayati]
MAFNYRGLLVPVFTPFNSDKDRSLNLSVIDEYAKYLSSKKITGILVNGSTGEGTLLSIEERKSVAEAWANAVKKTKQHLMIQVGGTSLNCVQELAAHAESLGADSILCLPELYFKPSNADELIDYLKLVGEAAPKTPLLYYDFPRATGVNVDLRKMFNSIGDKVPTFVGVKTDIERGIQARQARKDFRIFLAGDMMMIAGCVAAFDSFVMTCLNFIPEAASELLEFEKGRSNLTKARESQDFINTVVSNVTAYGKITVHLVFPSLSF